MSAVRGKPHAGQFKPGQSGNPAGRKPGSGAVGKLRAAITSDMPEIVARLTEQAKGGDTAAARLLLERVVAPLRPTEDAVSLTLPDGPAAEQGAAIIRAIAAGDLAPGQGATLLQAVANLARVVDIAELQKRIEALESKS